MSQFICCLWWFVLGVLVGWLLSWLLNRLVGRSRIQEVPAPAPPQPVVAPRVEDLTKIEGIGPKIAELLRGNGVDSFAALSRTCHGSVGQPSHARPKARLLAGGLWGNSPPARTIAVAASTKTGTIIRGRSFAL